MTSTGQSYVECLWCVVKVPLRRSLPHMQDHFAGLYLSFETDLRPERLHDAFPPRTLARLRALKARYDPDNVFRQNFPITPEVKEDARAACGG